MRKLMHTKVEPYPSVSDATMRLILRSVNRLNILNIVVQHSRSIQSWIWLQMLDNRHKFFKHLHLKNLHYEVKTIWHCHLRPRTRISDINTTATSSDFLSRQPFDHKHNQKHVKGQKKACVDSPQTHIPHPQTNHPSNTHHNHAHIKHRGVVDMYWRTNMYT